MTTSSTALVTAIAIVLLAMPGVAGAHSGGLDSNGGHYCRDAGYEAGLCAPVDSYHCHDSGCHDYDGPIGNGDGDGGDSDAPADSYEPVPPAGSTGELRARRLLRRLAVDRERRGGSYLRTRFAHWVDANDDGCDTRQAILISESREQARRRADCTVTSGRWRSPLDGRVWTAPSDVDVDHLVALKEAWVSGAHNWHSSNRRQFANDLRFRPALAAVTDNVNQSKGDRDPAEWLPTQARCRYAINWVQVKYRWRLKIDRVERLALAVLLSDDCGARRVNVPRRAR